jgi:high-affinity K+ transport system ATPase subunit B
MKKQHIILAVNLGVLLLYTVMVRSSSEGSERALGIMLSSAFLIFFHLLINLLLAAVFYRQYGKVFLLNALLVLLIGFSTCFVSTSTT